MPKLGPFTWEVTETAVPAWSSFDKDFTSSAFTTHIDANTFFIATDCDFWRTESDGFSNTGSSSC
jgi:carbamate kinase